MSQGRISKRAVDALVCPAGLDREFLWDCDLAGFGVAAFASGKKVYYAQYRMNGRSRRITLGDHGRLTPDEARSQAKKLLGLVETGADPISALVPRCFRNTRLRCTKENDTSDGGLEPFIPVDRPPGFVHPLLRSMLGKCDESLLGSFASHVRLKIEAAFDLRKVGFRDHLPPGIYEQELITFCGGEPSLIVEMLATRTLVVPVGLHL
jgi:Arm DNA-binding domain